MTNLPSHDPRPGDREVFRRVGPARRRYQLYIPASYRADRPVPLFFDFHPWQGTARVAQQFNGFEEVADEAGFVLARPEARSPGTGAPPAWGLWDDDEVQFVEAVLTDVRATVHVDPSRIYAVGMSQGAHFAIELASRRSTPFAAAASVAVLAHPVGCDPRPMPLIAFVGRNDPFYDLEKGLDASIFESSLRNVPPSAARPGPLMQEASAWASANGCRAGPVIEGAPDRIRRLTYKCPEDADIEVYIHDGGHVWPGPWLDPQVAEELALGPAT